MFHPDSWLIRFLARVCDLLFLNIALVLSCCTVVLSGTAVTALYSMTLNRHYERHRQVGTGEGHRPERGPLPLQKRGGGLPAEHGLP